MKAKELCGRILTRGRFCLVLALVWLGVVPVRAADNPLDHWTLRNPYPTADNLYAIAYGNGLFVSVGYPGTILTSPDGITWSRRDSGTTSWLSGVAYGNGQFVVVGPGGTTVTSPDGTNWTLRSLAKLGRVVSVAYGNGIFVAVGYNANLSTVILTSADGIAWTPRGTNVQGSHAPFSAVAYGNGMFLAVGNSIVWSSPDGITWTNQSSITTFYFYSAVAYGNGVFMALYGTRLGTDVVSSSNGTNWTIQSAVLTNALAGAGFGSGLFVGVGSDGAILTSPNGSNWTQRASGTTQSLRAVAYGNDRFVAVGQLGTILTSPDGTTWTSRNSGTLTNFAGVVYGNGSLVAFGEQSILTSPDGVNWTRRNSGTSSSIQAMAYGSGKFVAVGHEGIILTSVDGTRWTIGTPGATNFFYGVAYGNGLFVAVTWSGGILSSPDGVTWTVANSGTTSSLSGIAYGEGMFVVVGYAGTLLTSPDGINWSGQLPDYTRNFFSVAYGNGRFVTVGEDTWGRMIILTSPDGTTWTAQDFGRTNPLVGVAYGGGMFAAAGNNGAILTSPDGANWTSRNSGTLNGLEGVAYANGTFFAVGTSGTILQSDLFSSRLYIAACPDRDRGFSVRLLSPVQGAALLLGGTLWCLADVSNGTPPLQVQFFSTNVVLSTNVLLATITNAPYLYVSTSTRLPPGSLSGQFAKIATVMAVATDGLGNAATSAPVQVLFTQGIGGSPPALQIVSPSDGTVVPRGTAFTFGAFLWNEGEPPPAVDFYAGTNLLGTVNPWPGLIMLTGLPSFAGSQEGNITIDPYMLTISNLPPGNYELTARSGPEPPNQSYTGISAPVHMTVLPANIPPSVTLVSLTSPAITYSPSSTIQLAFPMTVYVPSSTIRLEAQASDQDGTVQQVSFYAAPIGSPGTRTSLGSASSAPWVLTWTNQLPSGYYLVSANAVDNGGMKSTEFAQGIILVTNITIPPVVDILSPSNGTRVALGANLPVQAQLTVSDNNINPVEFYVGTKLVGSVLNPPYQIVVSNLTVGTYTLSARIKSLAGLASTGAVAQVTVSDFLLLPDGFDSGGNFHLRVGGLVPGTTNVLEASLDLTAWAPLTTNIVTTNYLDFVDVGAANDCQRFYRCLRIP